MKKLVLALVVASFIQPAFGMGTVRKYLPVAKTNAAPSVIVSNAAPAAITTPSNAPVVVVESNVAPVVAGPTNAICDDLDATSFTASKGNQPRKAVIATKISNVRFGDNSISWDGKRDGWGTFTGSNGKTINAQAHLYWMRDGKLYGGRFDDCKVNQCSKDLANMKVDATHSGILSAEPERGATCYFCVISLDGSKRSNIVKASNGYRGK